MVKLYIAVIVLTSFALSANCQIEWVYKNQMLNEYSHRLISTKRGNYILLHGTEPCCPNGFTVLDGNGAEVFNLYPGNAGVYQINDITELSDSTIAITTLNSGTDIITGQAFYYNSILTFDHNWAMTQLEGYNEVEYNIEVLSNSNYVLMSGSNILLKSAIGEELWNVYLSGYECLDLAVNNSDNILVATAQGLVVLDNNGNTLDVYPSYIFDHIKLDGLGRLVGITSDSVYLLAPDLAILASLGFVDDEIEDYSVKDDTIVVLTKSNHVYLYHEDLSLVGSFQLQSDEEFKSIALGDNQLVFGGDETYGSDGTEASTIAAFVKDYSYTGTTDDLSRDIGTLGVNLGTVEIFQTSPSSFKVVFPDAKVTLRNFGDMPIESCYLHSKFVSKAFNNLSLQPGADIELSWQGLYYNTFEYPSGQTLDLCFWTSHPDGRLDSDAENDSYCTGFLVDANEPSSEPYKIELFPNPTSNIVNLRTASPFASSNITFMLHDNLGRIVLQKSLPSGKSQTSIALDDITQGMYFWKLLEEDKEQGQGKLIILK